MAILDAPRASAPALRASAGRLARALSTPLVPSDFIDLFSPLSSPTTLRARVEEVRPETRDAVTLVLQPGRGWRGHTAGQYIRIGVDVDGVRQWRAYSLTEPPRPDGRLTITVKAIPDGVVSNHLVRRAHPGLILALDQATGDFTLPATRPAKALFLTAGSGITPVMGMLRDGLADLADAVLVHCAPTVDDVIYRSELRHLAATAGLRLIERHDDVHGMLQIEQLDQLVPDLADRETWVCGPTGLLDAAEAFWSDRGISDRLHTERFRPTIVVAGEGGTVRFGASDITVDADASTPLLTAGEAAGVLMPSGCRMGICMGCVVPMREGAVRDLRTGELTTATEGDGVQIQTCISAAAGDCHIDL
ncbi:MAG TPA: ferredoxin reductase [Mycobacteriales bacterium]|nr:ferredoxin reductase [Mycobacteriales bacterium]